MMRTTLFSRLSVVVIVTLAWTATATPPARAGTVTITDGSGVDYDAACLMSNPLAPTPGPNSIGSPGTSSACSLGTYDGSTESTDIRNVSLSSQAVSHGVSNVQLVATCETDKIIPLAGSTSVPVGASNPDLPAGYFLGSSCKVMFQVPARQNNTPTNGVGGGAPRVPSGTIFDQHGHWLDGYHHFIAFEVV